MELGEAAGATGLGYAYASGNGVERDYGEAARWFRKAAERGQSEAQYNLGFLYERGWGVKLDYIEAFKWHTMAAVHGVAKSREALKALTQIMTPVQLERGYEQVAAWQKTHENVELASTLEQTSLLGDSPQ